MDTATIGIKTADRKFYPVLQEQGSRRRRVVLTTVHESQTSAQIDLYRGQGDSFENPEYVGSLLLEDIEPQMKGEPDIQLQLELDADGNLSASARELRSGSYQSLSLRLENLSTAGVYDIPDFEIGELDDELGDQFDETLGDDLDNLDLTSSDTVPDEDDFRVPDTELGEFDDLDMDIGLDEDLSSEDEDSALRFSTPGVAAAHAVSGISYEDEDADFGGLDSSYDQAEAVPSPALLVGFVILALAMLGILSYFVFRALEAPAIPPLEVEAFLPLLFVCRMGRTF